MKKIPSSNKKRIFDIALTYDLKKLKSIKKHFLKNRRTFIFMRCKKKIDFLREKNVVSYSGRYFTISKKIVIIYSEINKNL